jgi:hypothetical protein
MESGLVREDLGLPLGQLKPQVGLRPEAASQSPAGRPLGVGERFLIFDGDWRGAGEDFDAAAFAPAASAAGELDARLEQGVLERGARRDRERLAEGQQFDLDARCHRSVWAASLRGARRRGNLKARFGPSVPEQLTTTRRRYNELHTSLIQAEQSMTPVLKQFGDYVLYLKHNLNAQAIASLKGEATSIQVEITRLLEEMNRSITRADEFVKGME